MYFDRNISENRYEGGYMSSVMNGEYFFRAYSKFEFPVRYSSPKTSFDFAH